MMRTSRRRSTPTNRYGTYVRTDENEVFPVVKPTVVLTTKPLFASAPKKSKVYIANSTIPDAGNGKELLQKYATNMYNKWKKCAYVNHSMAQQKPVNYESSQRKTFMSRGNLRILQRESDDLPTHDHA